jgi:hypothetical protein
MKRVLIEEDLEHIFFYIHKHVKVKRKSGSVPDKDKKLFCPPKAHRNAVDANPVFCPMGTEGN